MRVMEIPSFQEARSFSDLANLYRARIIQRPDLHASMALPLLGYMAWPNDPAARGDGVKLLTRWIKGHDVRIDFKLIHQNWACVADVVSWHYAIAQGAHQKSRGGASINKSVFFVSRRTKGRGAKEATLWRHLAKYKDVSHLIASTVLVCADMQVTNSRAPFGIGLQELLPIRVVCLVPDLIIALALSYQKYGLIGSTKPAHTRC